MTREEIIAQAMGDGGNTTRAHGVLDALYVAGWFVAMPPIMSGAVADSLRQLGYASHADAYEAMAMELDRLRRGWGPSTPTERMRRQSDLWAARAAMERALEFLESMEHSANSWPLPEDQEAWKEAAKELAYGIQRINTLMRNMAEGIPDRETK